jgi:2'-5' RNA ligase
MAETYTGVIVALVPADSDPITTASSEPAHMTLAFLGDLQDFVPDLSETLVAEVDNYARRLSGPVVVPVREVGKLGDDGADVAFLEPTESLVALRAGLLESASNVADMAGQHDKFLDDWTSHVTLGYPDRPQNGEYAGETVTFDRIAVWIGDEHHDFAMEGEMSEKIEASVAPERFVIEFDYRSDGGDRIVGPFDTREDAESYVSALSGEGFSAEWSVIDLAAVVEEAETTPDDEMPTDDLDEDEEEITEIPVHGIATIEGRPTGDGRGFRQGGLTIGELPQPLGYEFEHGHGSSNSRVAIVGRIDEFFRKEFDTHNEIRWRGVILTTKEYAAQAIESIVDGSYTGVSVVVDDVTVDVEGKREQMRQRIEADMAAGGDVGAGMDVEQLLDVMVGNGETEVTWFSSARVRRFDMVPTGAYQEAYIGLGHDFDDEMTAEQLEASAAALADCGCLGDEADELVASAEFAPSTKDGPGWITHPIPTRRIRNYWVRGKGAAKIRWGAPGDFNRCRRQLAKYVQNPEWLAGLCANMHKEALGIWPGQHRGKSSLAASAAPLFSITAALEPIDAKLFQNPQLTRGTGVIVDGDRIYGHIATWRSCHVGEPEGPGRCTLAPRSRTNYAHFRTGTVMTSEGPIAVGSITMDTGHAGPHDSPSHAVAHYDNTGLVVADVACGEDNFGIWFSGRIRPNVTDEKRFALAASGRLSGDWRRIGNSYELVAALVVNSAGFPVADASLAASAGMGVVSIIGEGIVDAEVASLAASAAAEPTLNPKTVEEIAAAAAISAVEGYMSSQKRSEIVDRMIPARRALSAHLIANARERLQQEMRMSS